MRIIVGTMEFEIAEPYAAGQVMQDAEAKHLNELRGARIRGILAKRLAKMEMLRTDERIAMAKQIISDLDAGFMLKAPSVAKAKRFTLQDEIYEVARQAALDYGGSIGQVLEGAALESEITRFTLDRRVILEAERRFEARSKVTDASLDLLASD